VDADIGQSVLGPPTTIGLSLFESSPDWQTPLSSELFFIGSTTPEENLPLHLEGVRKMVDKAVSSGAEVILMDTTGLVSGEVGKELKRKKIDLLAPRFIIALQRSGELEPILEFYKENLFYRIFRLAVSEFARSRSKEERRAYRTRKFQEYFKASEIETLSTKGMKLEGRVTTEAGLAIFPESALSIKGLLVGLNDAKEDTLGLAVIQNFDEEEGLLRILTPLRSFEEVKIIHLSSLRLSCSYDEEWL